MNTSKTKHKWLVVALVAFAGCAELDTEGEITGDDPELDTARDGLFYGSPSVTSLRRDCGDYYAYAGWGFVANYMPSPTECDAQSPAGTCLNIANDGIDFDKRIAPSNLKDLLRTKYKSCIQLGNLSVYGPAAWGQCPRPDGPGSNNLFVENMYNIVLGRGISWPGPVPTYDELASRFYADAELCWAAAASPTGIGAY